MCDWEQTAFKSVWEKYASKLECLLTHQKWQTNKKNQKSILKSIKLASVAQAHNNDSEKPKNEDATEQNKIPKPIIHLP